MRNPIDRYVVYHSALGEYYFRTLKEARKFARDFERASWYSGYSATIYDTVKKCNVYY